MATILFWRSELVKANDPKAEIQRGACTLEPARPGAIPGGDDLEAAGPTGGARNPMATSAPCTCRRLDEGIR